MNEENTIQTDPQPTTSQVGTPEPRLSDKPSPNIPGDPTPKRFDSLRHMRVEKHRHEGLWVTLNQKFFPDLEVRIRDFRSQPVVVAQEAMEDKLKQDLGKGEDEKLPNEQGAMVTKYMVSVALVGARGTVYNAMPEQLEIARRYGWEISGKDVILTGSEDQEKAQAFFKPQIMGTEEFPMGSWTMTLNIVRRGRELRDIDDETIDRWGKDFVLGRHLGAELLD